MTFHRRKVGHVVAPGRFVAGEVVVAGIGLEGGQTRDSRVTPAILDLVPRRGARDSKYTAGHVLVVGGSPGMTGAVCLAAEAALRADAGYVTAAVPASSLPAVEAHLLEAVKRPLPEDGAGRVAESAADAVLELAQRAAAVALGPGLGRSDGTRALVARLLSELACPVVVDADALFGLAPGPWRSPVVLTPHAGELARLLGTTSAEIDAHRLDAVRRAADLFGCVCLLKGADTLVAAPGEGVLVSDLGTPALATAGTGDVLTGVVAAFLAKGLAPRLAAAAAAAAHGLAARTAPHQAGLVAGDVAAGLPHVLS